MAASAPCEIWLATFAVANLKINSISEFAFIALSPSTILLSVSAARPAEELYWSIAAIASDNEPASARAALTPSSETP